MTPNGVERWTMRGLVIEAGKGMPHAHKILTETGDLIGQRKRMVTTTAAETGTVTENGRGIVTEKETEIMRETEKGTGTEAETGKESVTATGIVKETTGEDVNLCVCMCFHPKES